jgi:hypothetical protein
MLAALVVIVGLGVTSATPAFSASSHQATKQVTITVRFIQEATYQYPHGTQSLPGSLVLSTTLRLFAVGTVLGFPNNTYLGTMSFTYQLHGSCGTSSAGCSGTTNLETLTTFPGGTITANGNHISLKTGLIVPVSKGTGIFKGVTGSIVIAPAGATGTLVANSIYRLSIPATN